MQSVSFAMLALMYAVMCEWSLLASFAVDAGEMKLPDGLVVKYVAEDGTGKSLDVRTGQTVDSDPDCVLVHRGRYNAPRR